MSSTQEMPNLTPENVATILTELKELRATMAKNENKYQLSKNKLFVLRVI